MIRMMKAVQIHQYGGTDVLIHADVPCPEPAAGEVLVRVKAAGINPIDLKTRSGAGLAGRYGTDHFPLILGWDISGVVEKIGSGVSGFEVGDAVYGMPCFPGITAAYAEFVTAPASDLALKPGSIDHLQAAAMPLVSLTAWQALFDVAGLKVGQKILVHAAAGGVGHIAVQLAKWCDAFVVGTASRRNAEFLAELGVGHFVDYQAQSFEDVVSEVDVVLDTQGGDVRERSWSVIKPGGIIVSIVGPPSAEKASRYGVRAASTLVHPGGDQLTEIAKLVDGGHLKPHVEAVYPLADVAQAHAHVGKGHTRGKVVLQVD
jgi:NADPH:quinone reductase-like Zn-dependent oxidoreductase